MGKVERFEDLECWKAAREVVVFIYGLCNNDILSKDFEIKNQLKRSALSIMNNIAEGFSRFHKNDFKRFLDIAQSSASEINSMTYVLEDLNYIEKHDLKKLRLLTNNARNLTLGLIKYLDKKQ
ncbi:four helix bundle protein [candidate division KSB1 bacterium]